MLAELPLQCETVKQSKGNFMMYKTSKGEHLFSMELRESQRYLLVPRLVQAT